MTAVADAPAFAPGLHDMTDEEYHRDPVPGGSLSSTGARRLLAPSCPALYRWYADNPQPPKKEFDFGHAAHKVVLGAGADLVVVEAENWLTKAAKEKKQEAYAEGKTPLLTAEMAVVNAMAAAVRAHPLASALLNPSAGRPEQSAFWQDEKTGIWRRARFDWLPDPKNGRMLVADYKTARSAQPEAFAKAAADHGYHQQAPYYLDAIRALELAETAAFVFVVQEKTAPYLVQVVELDETAMRIGRGLNREAIDIFAHCQRTKQWPDYTAGDVAHVSLPTWFVRQHELYL